MTYQNQNAQKFLNYLNIAKDFFKRHKHLDKIKNDNSYQNLENFFEREIFSLDSDGKIIIDTNNKLINVINFWAYIEYVENSNFDIDLNFLNTSQLKDFSNAFSDNNFKDEQNKMLDFLNLSEKLFYLKNDSHLVVEKSKLNPYFQSWDFSSMEIGDAMFVGSHFNQHDVIIKAKNLKSAKGMFAYSFFNRKIVIESDNLFYIDNFLNDGKTSKVFITLDNVISAKSAFLLDQSYDDDISVKELIDNNDWTKLVKNIEDLTDVFIHYDDIFKNPELISKIRNLDVNSSPKNWIARLKKHEEKGYEDEIINLLKNNQNKHFILEVVTQSEKHFKEFIRVLENLSQNQNFYGNQEYANAHRNLKDLLENIMFYKKEKDDGFTNTQIGYFKEVIKPIMILLGYTEVSETEFKEDKKIKIKI